METADSIIERLRGGDEAQAVAFVREHPECVGWTDEDGCPALLAEAIGDGFVDLARVLFHAGADPNAVVEYGQPPLFCALSTRNTEDRVALMEVILDAGADPDGFGGQEWNTLHVAAYWGYLEEARCLLDHGADVDARELTSKATPLMNAVAGGHLDVVRFLVERGARLSLRNTWGQDAIAVAQERQHQAIAAYLTECQVRK